MLVKDFMTRHPIMLPASTSVVEAKQIMTENTVRHLPIVKDGKILEGLITRQRLSLKPDTLGSLELWDIARYISSIAVKRVMLKRREVQTITADRTVERAAQLMTDHKIGCLPVLEDDQIVLGIITESDILRSYQQMLGLPRAGTRVTIRMPDQPGEFAKLMSILAREEWGVMGIGTFPSRRAPNHYDAVIKLTGVSEDEARHVLSQIATQEIIDIRTSV